jgi:hypothetical protein
MEITDVLPRSQVLIKELSEGLTLGKCNLADVEGRILKFLYDLGNTLEREVLSGVEDRVLKNLFEEAAHSFDHYRTPTATVSWPWPQHC